MGPQHTAGVRQTVFEGAVQYVGPVRKTFPARQKSVLRSIVKCEVCEHKDRYDIERHLLQSESISLTVEKYQVSPAGLVRHDAEHTAHPVKDLVRQLERSACLLEAACAPVLAAAAEHSDPSDPKTPTVAAVRNATSQQAEASRIRLKLFELRGGAMTDMNIVRHPHFKTIVRAICDALSAPEFGPDYLALERVIEISRLADGEGA
jgi:hypothetical protein